MPTDKALPLLGMVLVTHGRLAEEMVTAMAHVVGPQRAIATVCIGPNDNMEMRRKEIADAIRAVDEGRGVIMLTDLFGGTPSNLAISLLESGRTEVIAGVNLPMLLRVMNYPEQSLSELQSTASVGGRNAVQLDDPS